jgi:hypothetical protein
MTTFNVADASSLLSAFNSAHGGDTIALAPGDYGNVTLENRQFSTAVNITSQDPSQAAMFTGLIMRNDKGLNVSHMEFNLAGETIPTPFIVNQSSNISLSYLNVHGSLDGNPQDDTSAMMVQNSTNVQVTNSEFQQAQFGLAHFDDQQLLVSGNSFHDIRCDGVHGHGSSYVTISDNTFTDFYPIGTVATGGDHPDAIQFFTLNTSVKAHDLTVTGNTIVRGDGAAIQGIFFDDEVGNLPFQNVSITNNTVIGETYNGISVYHAANVTASGNLVQGYADKTSYLRLAHVSGATLTNNQATGYQLSDHTSGIVKVTNPVIAAATPDVQLSAYSTQLEAGYHTLQLTGFGDLTGTGNGLDDHILGNLGNDTLVAGAGNDVLSGGGGSNSFVFQPGGGQDTVTNFGAGSGDAVDLTAFQSAGLAPTVQDAASGLSIGFADGSSIHLLGVHPSQLTATVSGFSFG